VIGSEDTYLDIDKAVTEPLYAEYQENWDEAGCARVESILWSSNDVLQKDERSNQTIFPGERYT